MVAVPVVVLALAGLASAEDSAQATIGGSRLSAGDQVTLDEYVPGNVYLAAGRVNLDDRIGGSAFVTGGEVAITGSVGRHLYAAGGDLRIEGEVEGRVAAAGGKVRVVRGAELRENVTLAGGSVEMEGKVGGDLQVYGESLVINGIVGGDLEIAGEDIRVGPDARIAGRLDYRSGDTFSLDPQAEIGQGVRNLVTNGDSGLRKFGRGAARVGGAMFSLGVLLLGAILVLGLPAFSREASAIIRREWWQSAGIGCVMLIGVPFAIVILMVTIIGIPLALMMIFGYVVLLMLGYLIAALFVGDLALERLGEARFRSLGWRVLFLLLALVALSMVRQLPLIGGLVVALLFVAGIGAFTMRSWRGIRRRDDAVAA